MISNRLYLISLLSELGIILSPESVDGALISQGLDPAATYEPANEKAIKLAIIAKIPVLLVRPDITEAGYAEKWDRNAILKYYALLCAELGIEDNLNPKPKIRSKSHLW